MPERRGHLLLCLTILLTACPVAAQDVSTVKSELADTMQKLESAAKAQKELAEHEEKLRQELGGLQKELVTVASKIQRQEKILSELEANLVNLEDEEREASAYLERRQQELTVLTHSMLKLSAMPPEMVVAMPGDFEDTMRTAKVLGLTSNALSAEAKAINRQLVEVKALQKQIRSSHQQISRQKSVLERDLRIMERKIGARGRIQDQLLSRQEEQQAAVNRLSQESHTLRELMNQLEARRKAEAERAAKLAMVPTFKPEVPQAPHTASPANGFARAKGKIPLPAEGNIFIFYGDKTQDGGDSRGIRIRTRHGAQVTSPFSGEVVYTGTFLDYGNMVIIRHENDYHSLLAGMERITASLGQYVIKGEPVGEMGRAEEETALYMEIREHNRPIDPVPWLEKQRIATR